MHRSLAFVLGAVLLVAGCATSPKLSPDYVSTLQSEGVSGSTLKRIQNGRPLGYSDILYLVKRDVPDGQIVDYLKATQTPYTFSTAQLQQLQSAGASMDLIGYLKGSAAFYSDNPYLDHPYYNDPAFVGPPPFGWGPFPWGPPGMVY